MDTIFSYPNYWSLIGGIQWGAIAAIILWWFIIGLLFKHGKPYFPKLGILFILSMVFMPSLLIMYSQIKYSYA